MKRQCFRRIASALLALVLFASSMAIPSEVDAAVTAKSVIKKAVAELEAAESISYRMELTQSGFYGEDKNNTFLENWVNFCVCDDEKSYCVSVSNAMNGYGFEEYTVNEKVFRKFYYDSKWEAYTNSSYSKDNPAGNTAKTNFSYLLKNLKKPKLKSTSKGYVISGGLPKAFSGYKSVNIVIDKKTYKITGVKFRYKKSTRGYLSSEDTDTITGGTRTFSYISYGECKVELPDELEGL